MQRGQKWGFMLLFFCACQKVSSRVLRAAGVTQHAGLTPQCKLQCTKRCINNLFQVTRRDRGTLLSFQKSQLEKQPWTTEPIWLSNLNSLSNMSPRFLTTEMFFYIKGGKWSINTIIGTLMIATHCDLCLTVV